MHHGQAPDIFSGRILPVFRSIPLLWYSRTIQYDRILSSSVGNHDLRIPIFCETVNYAPEKIGTAFAVPIFIVVVSVFVAYGMLVTTTTAFLVVM